MAQQRATIEPFFLSSEKGVTVDIDATLVKLDCLCTRIEDLLAELQQLSAKRPSPYAKLRETSPNAGKMWSAEDDEELRRLFAAGNSVTDLALLFGRTNNGVRQRLERLGLISPAAA